MIIQPTLPSGWVLFADDVRQELSGKLIIIGTYGAELIASQAAVIPLSMVVTYRDDPFNFPEKISFVAIHKQTGEELVRVEMEPHVPAPPERSTDPDVLQSGNLHFVMQIPALVISESFSVSVRAYRGDDEVRLGSLKITLDPPANDVKS